MALFGRKNRDKGKEQKPDSLTQDAVEEKSSTPASMVPKGGDMASFQAIISPHITEKATNLTALNKYIFKVFKTAGKIQIKNAIESLYKVKVESVHVQNMPSKFRQVGLHQGKKAGFKKAIVTLKEGEKIDIAQ